jgi:O-antigen/teichoic acid export membrane protein
MASAIILLPFYIHYLSTEAFGALSIFLAFSILIQVITTFSYDATLYIHYHEYKTDVSKLSRYVSSAVLFVLTNGLIVTLFFVAAGEYIADVIFERGDMSFYPYGYVCVITGVFQSVFKIHNNLLQTRQKPEVFFWSNLLSFTLIAAFTIIGLKLYPDSLAGPLGGRLIAAVISGTWATVRLIKEFGLHFDYRLIRSSFSFNFYTLIYQLQQWIMNYFDRILIAFFLPLSQVGIYSFAVQCLMVIEFFVNGLYTSFYPKVVAAVMEQDKKVSTIQVNRYYYGLTAMILLAVSVCTLLFPVFLNMFVTKSQYLLSIPLMPFIAGVYVFKGLRLYFSLPYGILKYTKPLPVIYLVVCGLKIGAMFLLIDTMGMYGVIAASAISLWLEIALLYQWGRQKFQFNFNAFKLILLPFVLALLIVVFEPWLGKQYPLAVHAGYLLASLLLLFWVFRNEVVLLSPAKILGKS